MKKLLPVVLVFFAVSLKAQTKVASYFTGKYGSAKYEHFSFWMKDGKVADVFYAFGKDVKEVKLSYLGKRLFAGKPGFLVKFPNGYVLNVIPQGINLLITDTGGQYAKTFAWEYEGPVNGIGTFCESCAEDEKEALKILIASYLK